MKKRILVLLTLISTVAYSAESPCFFAGTVAKCFPTTGIYLDSSRTLRLGTNDTTHYVELGAANGVATSYSLLYPAAQGASGQSLSNDGSGNLSWVSPLVNPMTTTGDIVYSSDNSGTPARRAIGSATQVIHGGTTPSYSAVSLTADVTGTLPVANGGTGITSFGTGIATWLGTPSSANLAAAITDETGTGQSVFSVNPILTTPNLGVPTAITLTAATGLPLTSGVTGILPSINGGSGINNAGTMTWGSNNITFSTAGVTSLSLPTSGAVTALGGFIDLDTAEVTGVLTVNKGGSNKSMTLAAGGLLWTDADSFEVGAAGTTSDWALSGGTGAPTFSSTTTTGKFVDGSADQIQMRVQGHSTQTSDILTVEKSDATLLLEVTNTGGTLIRGDTVGTAPATGFVGELLSNANSSQSCNTTGHYRATNEATITLTPGTWDLNGCADFIPGATTTYTRIDVGYSTTSGDSATGLTNLQNYLIRFNASAIPGDEVGQCAPTYRVTVSTNTAYYFKVLIAFGVSTCSDKEFIRATRIK